MKKVTKYIDNDWRDISCFSTQLYDLSGTSLS